MDNQIFIKLQKQYSQMLPIPKDATVAMAYVPFQKFGGLYEESKALSAGTLFAELDKPFTGKVNIDE